MILHRKLGEKCCLYTGYEKIEGLFFECCCICFWSKIFLVEYVQIRLRNRTLKCYALFTYQAETERNLKAKTSEDFCVH